MSCRSSLLCRRPARPTPSAVWITDDILAEVFHRYVRVSLHNQRLHDGRRHGSNVPGPLEARRRSTRRRMGMTTVSATNASSGQDFGALFGLGLDRSNSRVPFEKGWKWEAPSDAPSQRSEIEHSRRATDWAWGRTSARQQHDLWDFFLQVPETTSPKTEKDLIRESAKQLQALLELCSEKETIRKEDLTDVVHFLQTSSDEPGAQNALHLFEWLASRPFSVDCITELAHLVKQKIEFGTADSEEISSMLAVLAHDSKPENMKLVEACLDVLKSETDLEPICAAVTRKLDQHAGGQPDSREPGANMLRWLRSLRCCEHMQGLHYLHPTWQSVYAILASTYHRPSTIAEHLIDLKYLDLSHILLRYWVPHGVKSEPDASHPVRTTRTACFKLLAASPPSDARPFDGDQILKDFQQLRQSRHDSRGSKTRKYSSLIDLLQVLRKHHLSDTWLTFEIFGILKSAGHTKLFGIFYELCRHPKLGVDTELAADLYKHFMKHRNPEYALLVFEAVPTLSLRTCFELPLRLAKRGRIHSSRILRLILRRTGDDFVHVRDRPDAKRTLPLQPHVVDLVHLLAYKMARVPHIPDRVAFRRVWECYRFLRDHDAPISSVLTRAIVHVGAIRPLRNWKPVGTVRFRWILDLVAQVEGREVAASLDSLVYAIWERDVGPKARLAAKLPAFRAWQESGRKLAKTTSVRLGNWHRTGPWIDARKS